MNNKIVLLFFVVSAAVFLVFFHKTINRLTVFGYQEETQQSIGDILELNFIAKNLSVLKMMYVRLI